MKKIQYKNKKIIIYIGEDNLAYFDLNHTINLFDNIKAKNKKYDEYKNNIVFYDTRNNEFGGLYLKEFISKEIFFKIILHTNSVFSNKFKDDVAKLLDNLTNAGNIVIKNDTLTTVQKVNPFIEEYEHTQTYDNIELLEFAKEQIRNSRKINYNRYVFTHIMYFFIITLDDPQGKNRILCKIGYTDDLLTRIKSLPSEYKCKFYLLNVKRINRLSDEQTFHNLIKKLLPHLFVSLKIGNHEKEETYVFDRDLYALFCNYEEVKLTNVQIKLEEETKQIFEDYFDNVEKRFELEVIKKMNQKVIIKEILNVHQENVLIKQYEYMNNFLKHDHDTLKEKHRHIEAIKVIDLESKTMDLESKKIDYKILKMQNGKRNENSDNDSERE